MVKAWIKNRGVEFYGAYYKVQHNAGSAMLELPSWVNGELEVTPEKAVLARRLLAVLVNYKDPKVNLWTRNALDEVSKAEAQMDPATLAIGGAILIGAILAARVQNIGSAKFYEGIDDSLADILKPFVSVLRVPVQSEPVK